MLIGLYCEPYSPLSVKKHLPNSTIEKPIIRLRVVTRPYSCILIIGNVYSTVPLISCTKLSDLFILISFQRLFAWEYLWTLVLAIY